MSQNPPMPSSFDSETFTPESTFRRILRRTREEPLVPLGMLLTVSALFGAGRAMKANDHVRANIMFRRRLYAQGFTLICVVAGGMYWRRDRERRKEYEKLEKERKDVVRREQWLRELEVRDREDREAKKRVEVLKERRRGREEEIRRRVREEIADDENEDDGSR